MKSRLILLSLSAAPLLWAGLAQAAPVLKPVAKPTARPTATPLPDAPELTMNRARSGTGQLKLGSGEFTISAATLVMSPRNKSVVVAFDTPRGKLLMAGHATTISGGTISFTLDRGTGSLAEALKMPKRLLGTVTGRVELERGKRTFSAITMSGKVQSQPISATFRSAPLPARKK